MQRQCTRCKKLRDIEDFYWRDAAQTKRRSHCRFCIVETTQDHYKSNIEDYRDKAVTRAYKVRFELHKKLFEYLKDHPCVDCGEDDIIVLEFDHLRDKKYNIANMISRLLSWTRILAEIQKCEVCCANCHRRRTARQNGSWRIVEEGIVTH